MKKAILIIVLLHSLTAGAQIQTGSSVFSGMIQFYTNDAKSTDWQNTLNENKIMNYSISPSYGYYVSENVAIGLGIGYNSNHAKNDYSQLSIVQFSTENKSNNLSFSPFVRLTHPIIEHLYCNLNIYFSYGFGSDEQDYIYPGSTLPAITGNQTSMSIGINPGLDYFLSNHFAFTFNYGNLSYISTTNTPKTPTSPVVNVTTPNGVTIGVNPEYTTSNSGFNFNLGISSISLGLRYYIHCKEVEKK